MTDVVSAAKRSEMMAGIRAKNTRPEILVRRALFALGFRFRLHDKRLPGTPDLVLRKHRAVVFVHGCFWHRHSCHLFKIPSSRQAFWLAKLRRNQQNDRIAVRKLCADGWKVIEIWECALKGPTRLPIEALARQVECILTGKSTARQIIQGRAKSAR